MNKDELINYLTKSKLDYDLKPNAKNFKNKEFYNGISAGLRYAIDQIKEHLE